MRYRALRGTGTTITTLFSNNLFWEKKKNRINMISPLDENTNQITHIFKKKTLKNNNNNIKTDASKINGKKMRTKSHLSSAKIFYLKLNSRQT